MPLIRKIHKGNTITLPADWFRFLKMKTGETPSWVTIDLNYTLRIKAIINGVEYDSLVADWTSQARLKLYEEQHHNCAECEQELSLDKLVLHHTIPIKQGGEDTIDNVTLVCQVCHKKLHIELRQNEVLINR